MIPGGCRPGPPPRSPTSRPDAPQPVVRRAKLGPLKVMVTADRDTIAIPETLQLIVHIEAETGVEVSVPKLEGVVGNFNVADATEGDPDCGDLARCREWTYTLESILPGAHEIPALTFGFRDPREKADGSEEVYEDTLSTQPIEITVTQTLADVKGAVGLPMPFRYKLLWWASGVIASMVAIALFVRWWRRRSEVASAAPAVVQLPPHVWALAELDKLAEEDLVGRGEVREFYYQVNGLVRRYIERRFGLMAGEQTTEEFIRALGYSDFLRPGHKSLLRQFVDACDPVKYALYKPRGDEIEWVQTSARGFVLETAEDADDVRRESETLPAAQEVSA